MLALYYHDIYILFVTIVTIIKCFALFNKKKDTKNGDIFWGLLIVLSISIFIGLRPDDPVFQDSHAYIYTFNALRYRMFYFRFAKNSLIFSNLLFLFASLGLTWSIFFLFNAFIYFGCTYFSLTKIFPTNITISFLLFLGAFSTYAYAVNGIRAGLAASLFYCAIAYKEKKILALVFLFISWGFHHSMHVSILAFIIVYCYSKPKIYYYLWIICLIIAICHISYFQILFARFTDEKGAGYLVNPTLEAIKYNGQMRYDFVLYSCVPMIVGYYFYNKLKINIDEYNFILCLYILLNSMWLLCMYARFTNRIAYLSWQLYPLLLAYPFMSDKIQLDKIKFPKNKMIVLVTLAHLTFTLFMHFVYYA